MADAASPGPRPLVSTRRDLWTRLNSWSLCPGAGKSTLAAGLARRGYAVVDEPVREWQDVEGHNLLGLLYADRPTWNFPFQALALATLGRRQQRLPADGRLHVSERSVKCSLRVFAQYLADEGALQPAHMA